ncbi:MAG: hypothetical protein QM767_03650 [Anaeromyxobacter sp.]
MVYMVIGFLLTTGLMGGMAASFLLGRRLGRARAARIAAGGAGDGGGTGALDGVVFALLGLLLAFTFSSASSRYDTRRQLIVEESNAIGTAYLRIDLLPAEAQPELRELFRRYTQSRLDTYAVLPDLEAARAGYQRSCALQSEIWAKGISAAKQQPSPAPLQLLTPALNEMFDIASTRMAATQMHQPLIVFVMLFGLALAAALLAGHLAAGSHGLSRLHAAVFVAAVATAVYVILDLEFPRIGLIRVDDLDALIANVLAGMK